MGAVRRTERVVDIDFRQRGKRLGEIGVVLGLARLEADVLEQEQLAGLQRRGLGLRVVADDVPGHRDRLAEQLAQAGRHRREGELGLHFALRTSEVGAEDDCRVVVKQVLDGRQGRNDALVRGDDAVLERDVEIAADEYLFAVYVDVLHRLFVVRGH